MSEARTKPAIRFAGFTDDWERRKLGELAEIGDIDHRMPLTVMEGIPYLMTGDFCGHNELNFSGVKLISENDYGQLSKKIKPEKDDIIFARYASVGAVRYVDFTRDFLVSYSCAIIKSGRKITQKYLYQFLTSDVAQKQIRLEINTGSQANIGIDSMKNSIIISVPCKSEQVKISCFLSDIDTLITIHQCKYDKLVCIKKAMLEKMFPKNGSCYPEIRFAGFSDAWVRRKLGDVFISLQNNTLSRAELMPEQGYALNLHYGDILIKFGEYLDVGKEELPWVSSEADAIKYKASYLQNGDVVVADTAEDETVGKCCEIAGLNGEAMIAGLHTIPYRPLIQFAGGFLGYYLNSGTYHRQLLPLMQGTKVTSISKTAMKDTDIYYPLAKAEQAKIGEFFRSLDRLITLQQQALEKLKTLKKAFLEKMFV